MEGISAVLIVKNEEKLLGRCLKSLVGLDEVVVLDTGSTDGTKDLARSLGAKVFEEDCSCPPEGRAREAFGDKKYFHFSKARNRATEFASHPWILSIDADEVLRPGSTRKIRRAIEDPQGAEAFAVTFVNTAETNETGGSRVITIRKTKIFRKDSWTWRHRVHEQLFPAATQDVPTTGDLVSVVMEHLPSRDKSQRHGQNIELMTLAIEEEPDYVRLRRHLGQELMLRKRWTDAIPHLAEYGEKTDEGPIEKSHAFLNIGECYAQTGRLEEAVKWFDFSHAADPRRREPLYNAGWFLRGGPTLEHLKRAAEYFEKAAAIPAKARPGSQVDSPGVWGSEPQRLAAECRRHIDQAVKDYYRNESQKKA